jgi:VanZ family protein
VTINKCPPKKYILYCGVLAGFILLFVGGPDYNSNRIFKAVWNLGHVPFMFAFGVAVLGVLHRTQFLSKKTIPVFYGCVVIGVALSSEYVQGFVGRTSSWSDVLADIFGGVLAWLFVSGLGQRLLTVLALVLCIIVITPFFTIMYDEVIVRNQFPLISGFENRTELSRWTGDSERQRSMNRSTEGLHSLEFLLLAKGYSGIAVRSFPSDWQDYRFLQFDVWSPQERLPVSVRIHDKLHTEGAQLYSDRFNRRYRLKQGWNRVSINLEEVRSAPLNRALNLSEVWELGLFSHNLGTQEKLYFDQLILVH